MAQTGYLLRRLPPLTPDVARVPIGPEQFTDLILDAELRFWAGGVLDWLRLANRRSVARDLPPPYPDARAVPRLSWPDDPWPAYYDRFTSITAPPLIRGWMHEDVACLGARAALSGRSLALRGDQPLNRRLDGLVQAAPSSLASAAGRDAKTTAFHFEWLDEHVFTCGPDASDHIHAYVLKLLVLLRNGLKLERHEAA